MARPKTAAAAYEQTTMRLPKDVRETLLALAREGRRPINTQAILVLRKALNLPDPEEDTADPEKRRTVSA